MLEVSNIVAGYGPVEVLQSVSLSVPAGAIVGILGANGAGKTTLMHVISGLLPVRRGTISLDGKSITGSRSDTIVSRGLIHVPQGRLLFPEMTVRENLEMGAYKAPVRQRFDTDLARIFQLFPILKDRQTQIAAFLSGGEQQMLAVARALMSQPRFLTLDEPSLGLAPKIFDEILAVIREINSQGIPILLAEQNARKVFQIAQHCYVIENGKIVLEGPSTDLARDPRVQTAYLGIE